MGIDADVSMAQRRREPSERPAARTSLFWSPTALPPFPVSLSSPSRGCSVSCSDQERAVTWGESVLQICLSFRNEDPSSRKDEEEEEQEGIEGFEEEPETIPILDAMEATRDTAEVVS